MVLTGQGDAEGRLRKCEAIGQTFFFQPRVVK